MQYKKSRPKQPNLNNENDYVLKCENVFCQPQEYKRKEGCRKLFKYNSNTVTHVNACQQSDSKNQVNIKVSIKIKVY